MAYNRPARRLGSKKCNSATGRKPLRLPEGAIPFAPKLLKTNRLPPGLSSICLFAIVDALRLLAIRSIPCLDTKSPFMSALSYLEFDTQRLVKGGIPA